MMFTMRPGVLIAGSTDQHKRLCDALGSLRDGVLSVDQFAAACRDSTALLASLPPRYPMVLDNLLQRLETGALFAQESCSFSPSELQQALESWLSQAAERLAERTMH